jgi:hypothetical protein
MGWREADTFCSACAREIAPGMIEATIKDLFGSGFAGLLADERLGDPGGSQGEQSALLLS